MSDQNPPTERGTRGGTLAIIAALVVVIVAAVVIGVVSAQPQRIDVVPLSASSAPATSAAPVAAAAAPSVSAAPSPSAPASASSPAPSASAKASSAAPAPQPTTTAPIAKPAVIVKALTATVTEQAAVAGQAQGPGEIAGPAVRFTIRISNSTGKNVDLTGAVVNAYSGSNDAPATQLDEPGGRSFPDSVKDGQAVTGVFVFTIPVSQRDTVLVTLDTSVADAVVAFRGPAPK